MTPSVSVVVCCHNSARRLPETLRHLAAQQVEAAVRWEVLVVDNASTDGTAEVARHCWPARAPVPLRLVLEPELGLSHARRRGFAEARGDIVGFVDDDNWVCADWVSLVSDMMGRHPDVGACGGRIDPVFEAAPPAWFARFQESYAVGPQAESAGDIPDARGYLWGAGLSVRRSAWQHLVASGFRSLLDDRRGTGLSAGGDAEMCFALRGCGWRIWYVPRLALQHFIPAQRAEWRYLRRLQRGFGAATVGHDPYRTVLGEMNSGRLLAGCRAAWPWQVTCVLLRLLLDPHKLLLGRRLLLEGDAAMLRMEFRIGRLRELLHRRQAYDRSIREALARHRALGRPSTPSRALSRVARRQGHPAS